VVRVEEQVEAERIALLGEPVLPALRQSMHSPRRDVLGLDGPVALLHAVVGELHAVAPDAAAEHVAEGVGGGVRDLAQELAQIGLPVLGGQQHAAHVALRHGVVAHLPGGSQVQRRADHVAGLADLAAGYLVGGMLGKHLIAPAPGAEVLRHADARAGSRV